MAEAHLAAKFNKENYPVVDHYTYVLGGDGCMMEGISSEYPICVFIIIIDGCCLSAFASSIAFPISSKLLPSLC